MQEDERLTYKIVTAGAYFGDTDIIERRNRTCRAKAISDCQLYQLSRTEFENTMLEEFPSIYKEICRRGRLKDTQDILKIRRSVVVTYPHLSESEIDQKVKAALDVIEECKQDNDLEYEIKSLRQMFEPLKEKNLMEEFIGCRPRVPHVDLLSPLSEPEDVVFTDVDSSGLDMLHEDLGQIATLVKSKKEVDARHYMRQGTVGERRGSKEGRRQGSRGSRCLEGTGLEEEVAGLRAQAKRDSQLINMMIERLGEQDARLDGLLVDARDSELIGTPVGTDSQSVHDSEDSNLPSSNS